MHELLALFSLWSLFSVDFVGIPIYPSYFVIPLLLLNKKYIKSINKFIFLILPLYSISVITKPYLIGDVFKITFMLGYLVYVHSYFERKRLLDIIDISVCIMVAYGLFQYLLITFGQEDPAVWLHSTIGTEGFGGAYDVRDGNLRVASFTKEPSYFAFTVGVYIFITNRYWVRVACLIGAFLSLSLISWYAVFGITAFYILNRYLNLRVFFYLLIVTATHVFFVAFLYEFIPPNLAPTFDDRYAGLHYMLSSSNLLDLLTGASNVKGREVDTITRGFSNISSLSVNFGIMGLLAYNLFIDQLGKYNKLASIAFFMYCFNFYYLTGWPSYVIFIYLIFTNEAENDSSCVSDYSLFQFRKNNQEST
jgi:uncharacterized membrane protein YuzA (DUF378 family)